MPSPFLYKGIIAILLVSVAGTSGVAAYFYQQQNTKISQASDLNGQIATLQNEISTLTKQMAQEQALNAQLGGNNSQMLTQIQQLQSQIAQLQTQVANLNAVLRLQNSRVIANAVCIYADCPPNSGCTSGCSQVGAQEFIVLGSIPYSGYLRVSWTTGSHVSFSVQVYDVNITTPTATSGVYSLPVGVNATGNAWFTSYDCTTTILGATWCPPVTYSMTYWY